MIDYNDMIGKPFEDGGRGPEKYDCYGVLYEVMRRNGINIPVVNISVYAAEYAQKEINKNIKYSWEKVNKINLSKLPIGILMNSFAGFAQHIGVLITPIRILHANINQGVILDHISNIKHRIIGYYTYVGNNDNK